MKAQNLGKLDFSGKFTFKKYDKRDKLVQTKKINNIVVDDGLAQISKLIIGKATNVFDHIAIGTATSSAISGDTSLGGETHRGSATTSYETDFKAKLVNTFNFTGSYSITESGVFDSSSDGSMACRQSFSEINVSSGDSLEVTWKIASSSA